jgi:alpha/beta superfamily hydrolase
MIDYLARDHGDLLVAGFSFGAWVGLEVGARDPRVGRLVGLGLPVNVYDFGFLGGVGKSTLVVHGDEDRFGDLDRVRAVAATAGDRVRVATIDGGDHFFTGRLEAMMEAVTSFAREPSR